MLASNEGHVFFLSFTKRIASVWNSRVAVSVFII